MRSKIDWKRVQEFYDAGHTYKDITKEFGICQQTIANAKHRGNLVTRNASEALKLHHKTHGSKTHSAETKQKISKKRLAYLKEHPEKVPYRLNHYTKGPSYPEQYFQQVFINEQIPLEYHIPLGIYELDFANLLKKIDVEIDGDQHHLDKRIKISDERRNKKLIEDGWMIFRIRWSDYQKLTHQERKDLIEEIKKLLD